VAYTGATQMRKLGFLVCALCAAAAVACSSDPDSGNASSGAYDASVLDTGAGGARSSASSGGSGGHVSTMSGGSGGSNHPSSDSGVGGRDASVGGGGASSGGRDASAGSGGVSTGGRDASAGAGGVSTGGRDASAGSGGASASGGAAGVSCGSAPPDSDAPPAKPECYVDGECATQQSCTGSKLAKICVPERDYCDTTLPCAQNSAGCVNHRCLAALPRGASCTSSKACDASLYCAVVTDACASASCLPLSVDSSGGTGVCTPRAPDGTVCDLGEQCQNGVCSYNGDFDLQPYVCRGPGGEGARCDYAPCASGLECLFDPHNFNGDPNFPGYVHRCTSHSLGTKDAYCVDPIQNYDLLCDPGLDCQRTSLEGIYQCEPLPELGQACGTGVFLSFPDTLACDWDAGTRCKLDLSDGGTSVCAPVTEGAPCSSPSFMGCGAGFTCDCSGPSCVCRSAAPSCAPCGDAAHTVSCDDESFCGSDHLCHPRPSRPGDVCVDSKGATVVCDRWELPPDAYCGIPYPCEENKLYCGSDGRCHARPGVGEPCTGTDPTAPPVPGGAVCEKGLRCVDGFLDGTCQ
jgi:hypothetical protein